jgi:stage II sporulation protein M
MGKRAQRSLLTEGIISFILSVGLLAVFFLAGMILGQVHAAKNSGAIAAELHRYLIDYCGMDSTADRDGWVFFSALIIYFRYPLLAALL